MKKFFATVAVLGLLVQGCLGTSWFVRTNAVGSANGTDWNDAWAASGINWTTVQAGDNVWLAGGVYASPMSAVTRSGVNIYRVLSTDAVPTAAAGWNSSFDSQVNFIASPASPGYCIEFSGTTFSRLDGRIRSGILLNVATNSTAQTEGFLAINCVSNTIAGAECKGPGTANFTVTFYFNTSGFTENAGNGDVYTNCWSHLCLTEFYDYHDIAVTLDHTALTDCGAPNGGASGEHNDLVIEQCCSNLTFVDCVISNWNDICVEQYNDGGDSAIPVTGNTVSVGTVWVNFNGGLNGGGGIDCLWPANSFGATQIGTLTFINNTVLGLCASDHTGTSLTYKTGSIVENNIYYTNATHNAAWASGVLPSGSEDYDFADAISSPGVSGSHSILNGSNPFVNFAGGDYRIINTGGTTYPLTNGVSTVAPADMNGTARANPAPSRGAFEYFTGALPIPGYIQVWAGFTTVQKITEP